MEDFVKEFYDEYGFYPPNGITCWEEWNYSEEYMEYLQRKASLLTSQLDSHPIALKTDTSGMTETNTDKIDELLHNVQISVISQYCIDKKTHKYNDKAHVSAIYKGMTTFIKEFVKLGYNEKMLSDWVADYGK